MSLNKSIASSDLILVAILANIAMCSSSVLLLQAAEVQRTAHECLHTASQHWADHHLAPGAMMLSQQPLKPLPPPSAFTSLPGEGQELEAKTYGSVDVAAICAHLAPSLIAPLLAACGHWTARERERGLQALAALAGACRHPSTAEPLADKLPQIMQILCTSLVDDEDEVKDDLMI